MLRLPKISGSSIVQNCVINLMRLLITITIAIVSVLEIRGQNVHYTKL